MCLHNEDAMTLILLTKGVRQGVSFLLWFTAQFSSYETISEYQPQLGDGGRNLRAQNQLFRNRF